ncbi:unnamed protein product [Aureobasidium vineae]|uniref:WGR domain-containing protein n=1 Tax=Aureobasidium vineae TaxID=2773715 RepID=A0A9N8J9H6_9PEZI|nr:unnamed protein product [Aureobasidium vineae]
MPSPSIPNKKNTSRTNKGTPVEVKNGAEGRTTTYEHGDVSLKAIKKVHRDRRESCQARARTSSKIDYSEKSEAELRRELTRRAKNANKAELTEILQSVDRILAYKTTKVLSVHTTSSKTDAKDIQAASSQSEHKDDHEPKRDMITYEDLTLTELKNMAHERGVNVKNRRAKAPFVTALKDADEENKENIPPGTDEASKQDVDLDKHSSGRIKRLEKTTKKPSRRTKSSSPNHKAQPALSQPRYHCEKCKVPSASEELHRDPKTRGPYYAYLRYEDDTSNKFYRLQVSKPFSHAHTPILSPVRSSNSTGLRELGTMITVTLHTGSHMCIPPMKIYIIRSCSPPIDIDRTGLITMRLKQRLTTSDCQVTKSGTEDLYYVRTHWGRHETSNPFCGSYGFKSPDDAIAKFGEIFKEKTSLDWGDRDGEPKKKKKYSYIKPKDGSFLQDAEDGNVGSGDGSKSQRTDLVDDNLSHTDTSRVSVKAPSGGSNSDRGVTPTPTKFRTRAGTRTPTPRKGLRL